MPNKLLTKFYGATALALGIALSATPAHAGFQWVAPANDSATYQQQPQQTATTSYTPLIISAPVATEVPEVISPVIISGDTKPQAPVVQHVLPTPTASAAPVAIVPTLQPMAPVAAPASPSPVPNLATATISVAPNAAPDAANVDSVQGFATRIPLALGLRQILPAGYNFSIDQNVSMDTLISYRGGRPWRDTLRDVLASVGLSYREQGTSVTISRTVQAAAVEPILTPVRVPTQQGSYLIPPPSSLPTMTVANADGWTADRGETLRKVLTDWCKRTHTELQWLAEYDYPVEASAHFNGGFEDAVRNLLAGFDSARPQPVGELHTNAGAGQMVLVVQTRGNSYSN